MKAEGNNTRSNPNNPYNEEKDRKKTKPGIKNWSTQKGN